jgi:hypothetical protein
MKRITFAFCILAVLTLFALAALAQVPAGAVQALNEVSQDENAVVYEVGSTSPTSGPITIRWRDNFLSFIPMSDPWIMFNSYSGEPDALPLNFSIHIATTGKPLDQSIVPEGYKKGLENLSYMVTETLRQDEEAGKLTADAMSVLASLRDGKYSFSDDMSSYIDLRWGYSYAGDAKSLNLDFSDGNGYFHVVFEKDGFTADIYGSKAPGSIAYAYAGGKLTGSYGYGRTATRETAMEELKAALKSIGALLRITRQPVPSDVTSGLALMEKAARGGFADFKESPAPTAET